MIMNWTSDSSVLNSKCDKIPNHVVLVVGELSD